MKPIFALAILLLPLPVAADDYLGILKAPQTSLQPLGVYSLATAPAPNFAPLLGSDNGYKVKLGYKYSRYFAVEGEFADFARPLDAFANPANLSSAFRSTGFGVDTVATLPLWRFSFYGRMGAYRGDRNSFSTYSGGLLGDNSMRGTRWRYGLGMRYDFTQSFGVRAEVERHSLGLGSPLAGDLDSDQVTVGVSWRF
ncbi:MAG TPA: outer membrane beta-barrel protein [Usitatibacter sp.]|nr:outer membrane beta-barrel protein [Usitatibacter sp.]